MKKLSLVLCTLAVCATCLSAQSAPALYGRLTVNKDRIVFTYAGDLWSVQRSGGEAQRLTSDPGEESFPVFSPDGSQLAFSKQVGGNWDVYVMPTAGGEAKQVTFHPRNDYANGWSADGKNVLFMSTITGVPRLYMTEVGDGLPKELPLPDAYSGSLSPDGKRVAYDTSSIGDWRFYRGGDKGRISLVDIATAELERLPEGDYNDNLPLWIGNKIYFASDRTGIYNLYSFDLSSKQARQLTNFEKFGIRWLGAGSDTIVFVRDGQIYLHEVVSGKTRRVDVHVAPDTTELKAHKTSAENAGWLVLSTSGDKVIVGSRGDVFVVDAVSGEARNVTATSSVAERYPALSPDGKLLAYFSDESGEYQLHVQAVSGNGPLRKIRIETNPTFYRELTWSPDSRRIAFSGKRLDLWIADLESGKVTPIDKSVYSYQQEWSPQWSPDGRWLTYSKQLHNRVRTVFIYDPATKQAHQITDGLTHAELPCFDSNGKFLYFVTSPNAGTSEYGWGVLKGILARPLVTRSLHAAVLANDQPALLLPTSQPNPAAKATEAVSTVRIDFENIGNRIIDLPLPARDYSFITTGKPGMLYALINEWPASPGFTNPSPVLYKVDLTERLRLVKLVENCRAYEISRDGSHLLFNNGGDNWFLVSAAEPPKPNEGKLDLKKLEMTVDPVAEWKQMYHEAWRIMRDWFYDSNYHGQNLAELETHYAEYLPSVTRRADLNVLMNRMLGHISVGHLVVSGGDLPQPGGQASRIGLLGADYETANGRYRFKHIYRSTTYNSVLGTARSPLDQIGVTVREGEYLLAVDGVDVSTAKSIYEYFSGKANQEVKLRVGPNPSDTGARTLTVFPIANESDLRLANWAEENRRRVTAASGGKLGYIYVSDYGSGTLDFIRGLAGYSDKAGVIIDQRYNGGGITPDYLIEWLLRKPIYFYTFREGDDIATPINPGPAAKVLIINEENFSAAETFALMYKLAKVGPIVGKRTGGGGIGPYVFTPRLVDGGSVQLPNRAAYNPDGSSWGIENVGVVPDYEVEVTPHDFVNGRDPQLEKAIQVALDEIRKHPAPTPKKPKYPIHR